MAYDETHDRLTVETCQGYNAFPDLADGTAEHQKTFNLSTNSQTRHVFRLSALDGTINHLLPCHATPCHDMSCIVIHGRTPKNIQSEHYNSQTRRVFLFKCIGWNKKSFPTMPCHMFP